MSSWLKVGTAQSVELGPFIDDTDFKTPKTGLTIAYTDVQLIYEGGSGPTTKNDTSSASHIGGGHYRIPLNTSDTAFVGKLRVYVNKTGALPVWRDLMVITANFYDGLITGNSTITANVTHLNGNQQALLNLKAAVDGTGYNIGNGYITVAQVNAIAANAVSSTAVSDAAVTKIQTGLATASAIAALNNLSSGQVAAAVWGATRSSYTSAGTFGQGVASVQGNVTGSVQSVTNAVSVNALGVNAITASSFATDAITATAIAADAVTEIQTGLATASAIAALNNLSSTQVAAAVWGASRASYTSAGTFGQGVASVQGNVTGSVAGVTGGVIVSSLGSGAISSTTFATGAITSTTFATDAISAAAIAAAAVTKIQNSLATASAVSALNNLGSADVAAAVWNATRSSYTSAGTFGQGIASVQGNVTGSVGSVTGGVTVSSLGSGAITSTTFATDAISAAAIAAAAVTKIQNSLATASAVSALNNLGSADVAAAVWNATRSNYTSAGTFGQGVASVQGNVTGSVAGVTGNVGGSVLSVTNGVAVASIANGAITAAVVATNAIDADALATDAVTELVNAFWTNANRTLTAATNLTSTGAAVALHTDNKVLLAGTTHTNAVVPSVTALNATAYAAIAAEVWGTAVPGSFGADTAGYRLGTHLDGSVSTVLAAVPSLAAVRDEVEGALVDYRLHELLAAELGSPPNAASLFGELTEDDGGTRRFTANALEMGPSGEGASPATVAAEVWNSALASFQLAGSAGEALGTAAAAGGSGSDPWSVSLPGSYTGAQAGKVLGDVLAATTALPSAAAVRGALETAGSKLDLAYAAVTSGTLFGNVAAIRTKTDNLPANPASTGDIPTAAAIRAELDTGSTRLAGVYQNTVDVVETLAGGGYFHGLVDGIRARTDLLPSSPAATGDIPSPAAIAAAVLGSPVPAAYGAGTLGHIVGSRLDAAVSTGHAVLDGVKSKTDLIPAVPLTTGDVATLLSGLKLDQLLAATATPPAADSFLGRLLEASAGSYRFKATALAQAPAAQLSVDAGEIAAGVWNAALVAHANAGTFGAKVNSLTSLSTAQLQDAIWLAGPDSHGNQPGTFGWMLDARISGLLPNSAGTGAVTFVYAVTNGINQQPIPEVVVTVSTDPQGQTVVARARTILDGTCTFRLNPGTYYFWRARSGWAFINPDVETVTETG